MNLPENAINKYNLEKKIKSDGFGSTYQAKIKDINNPCIVKHLNFKKSEMINRVPFIEKEATVMKDLNHPNIPKFIDFIIDEKQDTVDVYLIQEYIKASNLYQLVKSGKTFTETEVIKIAMDICKILDYLHSFSPPIIHQDIKPANILMTNKNIIYLIDFGSVKQSVLFNRADEMGLSTIIGTQGYMPIEQFEGRTVPASDIYALGLSLIFLLSGKEPMEMDKNGLIIDFRKYVTVSDEFKVVLEKMLHPDYKLRYQSSAELAIDLLYLSEEKRRASRQGKRVYEMGRAEINDTEKLRWYGKNYHPNYFKTLFIVFNILSLFFFLYTANIDRISAFVSFIIFSTIAIDIVAFYLIAFGLNFFKRDKKIYALSNKRIIIISDSKVKKVNSYNLNTLMDIIIYRQNSKKDTGYLDFIFENENYNFSLKNIENASLIFKIVKKLISERRIQ
jgi:serine/threonine protein kinase